MRSLINLHSNRKKEFFNKNKNFFDELIKLNTRKVYYTMSFNCTARDDVFAVGCFYPRCEILLKTFRCGVRATGCLDRMTTKAQRRQLNKQNLTLLACRRFKWANHRKFCLGKFVCLRMFVGEIIVGYEKLGGLMFGKI